MKDSFDFIVIGAGLSGLVCAYRLQEKGYKVLVIEKAQIPGGRLQTVSINGCRSDTGAQFLSKNYPVLTKLVNELNLSDETSELSPSMNFISGNKQHRINIKNPFALYHSGLLPFSSFSRLSMNIFKNAGKLRKLNVENAALLAAFDQSSAEEYLHKRLDPLIKKNLFEPFFSGFNYSSSSELSEAMIYRTIGHFLQRKSLFSLNSGLATLTEALASRLKVVTGKEVKSIYQDQEMCRIEGEGFSYTSKKVVIATTAPVSRALLGHLADPLMNCLKVNYAPSLHMGLVFKRIKEFKAVYGNMIMQERNPDINVITFESQKGKSLCTDDTELIHILASREGYEKELRGEEILSSGMRLIEEISPYRKENLQKMIKNIWPHAIPIFSPGRARVIQNYRKNVSRENQIFLVGDYMGTPCTEGAAESGEFISSLFPKK